jgi:hypothetical protein
MYDLGLKSRFKNLLTIRYFLDTFQFNDIKRGSQTVSEDQIQHALGGNFIQQIAQQLGSSKSEVSSGLANLLPDIIDKLTPTGKLPEGDQLSQELEMLKKSFLKA